MQTDGTTRVMIATPCLNTLHIKYVASLISLLFHKIDGVEYRLQFVADSMTYTARINLAQMAVDIHADYILWIDSDMVFPADTLEKLLKHDVEMVTGLYFMRRGNHDPVIYSKISHDGGNVVCKDYPKNELFTIAGCGFGMVLMKMSVIQEMIEKHAGFTFQPFPKLGEDLSFCLRYGKEIWCDPTIKLGHIGEYEFTEEDWKHE